VPRQEESIEDTIMSWLASPDEEQEEEVAMPRVISMPDEAEAGAAAEAPRRSRGPIRRKSDAAASAE